MTLDILVYHPWIKGKGGIERVLLEYADKSKHNIDLVTHYKEESFEDYSIEIEALTDKDVPEGFLRKGLKAGYEISSTKLDLEGYDLLLVSEAGIGSLITLRNNSLPTAAYCHTVLRAAHGFKKHYLDKYSLAGSLAYILGSTGYRFLEKIAWRRFDRVVCNSFNTRDKIVEAGLDRMPLKVVHPGADIGKFKEGEKGDYFFYPSRFKGYKRQELAVEAFEEFNQQDEDYRLVLAGFPDDEGYLRKVEKKARGTGVEVKEDISDEELVELYSNCLGVLFTAKDEDWGIVPIEAMASGKPVVAVNEGGPTESITHGETGFLTDSEPEKIASEMEKLLDDNLYDKMSKNCKERAEKFTWESFAEKLDGEVEQLV
ncbi:MAG: glycosyltransferase [Candidatus Nanohaloarchaeota archaeon QJJ-9]|nr:glycosyltransferase [Candidatus Nanohaloarchaeota archaeon QJJ-9]